MTDLIQILLGTQCLFVCVKLAFKNGYLKLFVISVLSDHSDIRENIKQQDDEQNNTYSRYCDIHTAVDIHKQQIGNRDKHDFTDHSCQKQLYIFILGKC